ncbi:MAG TPA: PEGA domain-containing protein [Kofleriaceae bacterium]|nr:PEGA domain-containing protein [Kofleriaceae bacterium]
MRVLLSACALAIAVLAPRAAAADGAGVIAASGPDRAAVAEAMARALAAAGRVRVTADAVADARAALAAGAVPADDLARFRSVREQIDLGWRAYLRVAVESAQLRLVGARAEAEGLLALPGGAELYADLALRLGAVLGHLGRRAEAQAVLALALALDPDRPITLAEFSPDVIDAVDAAKRAPAPIRRLRIATTPPGALIRVDGADVGRAPVDVEVVRGQHVIVARSPLHRPAVRGVAVDDAAVSVSLELAPDEDALRLAAGAERGLAEPAAQALIDAALRFADLDEVIVVADTTRRGAPTLLVQRCATPPAPAAADAGVAPTRARCSAVVELGYGDRTGLAAAARAAWDAARTGELRYPPVVLGERGGRTGPERCKLCRSPLLWTGVGAAVVAGIALVVVATSGAKPAPIVGVDPSQF